MQQRWKSIAHWSYVSFELSHEYILSFIQVIYDEWVVTFCHKLSYVLLSLIVCEYIYKGACNPIKGERHFEDKSQMQITWKSY